MREFSTQISESFKNGLRPTNRLGLNQDFLFQSKNAKPAEDGLVPYEAITVPFSAATLTAAGITISSRSLNYSKGKV